MKHSTDEEKARFAVELQSKLHSVEEWSQSVLDNPHLCTDSQWHAAAANMRNINSEKLRRNFKLIDIYDRNSPSPENDLLGIRKKLLKFR